MRRPVKIIVNAIPLTNIHTGISRYLACLYSGIGEIAGRQAEIWYFDGQRISRIPPEGPANQEIWTKCVDWFWQLPVPVALLLRLAIHYKRELSFIRAASGMDIYHEAGFFPFSVPQGVKTVFTIHDLSIFRLPQHHPRERVLYFRLFLRRRCRWVNRFLAVSHFTCKEMGEVLGIFDDQVTVTPLAHDRRFFYSREHLPHSRVLHGRTLPERYFLFVGSGDPRKNMDVIPAALKMAQLDIPLVVAGWSGWSGSENTHSILHFGYLPDDELAMLYSHATAMVFPSAYEGFGLPVLEAMACGCPVITTREASIPEVAGQAALFMDSPRDIPVLADLLRQVADNPGLQDALRQRGLVQASRFSWSATADATWNTFQQVLAR